MIDGLDLSPWIDAFQNLTDLWTRGMQAAVQAQIDGWKLGQQQMGAGMDIFQSMLRPSHGHPTPPKP